MLASLTHNSTYIPCNCTHVQSTVIQLTAVRLLLNLEVARQERSMLFSDEQKLLFEGGKKGFVKNTKLDFMRR